LTEIEILNKSICKSPILGQWFIKIIQHIIFSLFIIQFRKLSLNFCFTKIKAILIGFLKPNDIKNSSFYDAPIYVGPYFVVPT